MVKHIDRALQGAIASMPLIISLLGTSFLWDGNITSKVIGVEVMIAGAYVSGFLSDKINEVKNKY